MSFGMYAASVPAFLQMLKNLTAILEKAEAFAEERDIEPEVMLNWRLAPDMFPLVRAMVNSGSSTAGTTFNGSCSGSAVVDGEASRFIGLAYH